MKKAFRIFFCLILTLSLSALAAALPAAAEGNVSITVNTDHENVCFGIDYLLPAPTAADEAGNDVTDRITVTVQHINGDWTDVDGFSSVPWQPGLTFPITEHVEYRVIYSVPGGGENAQAVKSLSVMDTLQSVSVSPAELRIPAGSSLSPGLLTVSAVYSRSGSVPLSPEEYSLITDAVDFSLPGQYPASVSFTAPYGGTKTAQFTVTVEENAPADLSSLSLRPDTSAASADIPFGGEYVLPGAVVTATDAAGSPLDLSGSVRISVFRLDGEDRLPIEGLTDLPDTPDSRRIPITEHGSLLAVYSVTNGDLSAESTFALNVHDTLMSVSVSPDEIPTAFGEVPDYEKITVKAVYSLSGETVVPKTGYTLNTENVNLSGAGTYPASVSVSAPYGGTKTAQFTVTVEEKAPADLSSLSLRPDASAAFADIPFGGEYVLPGAVVTATDAAGSPLDLSGSVRISVFRLDGEDRLPIEGLTDLPDTPDSRRIPITEHGSLLAVYSVTNGDLSEEAAFALNVHDTLMSVSVSPDDITTAFGEMPDYEGITVKALWSLSGETVVSKTGYTLNTENVNLSAAGTYPASVSVTAPYGGTKTAQFTVTVKEDEPVTDLTSVRLTIDAEENTVKIPFGGSYTVPSATVTATDRTGEPIELSGSVSFTVWHGNGTEWTQVEGLGGSAGSADIRTIPITEHGTYKIVYSVKNGSQTAEAEYYLSVQDTLLSVSVSPYEIRMIAGSTAMQYELSVTALYSLSGEVKLTKNDITVDTKNVNISVPGEYPASVSVTAPYGGTKTAEFRFIIIEDTSVDLSSVSITLSAPSNQANAAFGQPFTIPSALVHATDKKGKALNLQSSLTVSVYHSDGLGWEPMTGMLNLKYSESMRKLTISRHGSYRIVYAASNGSLHSEAEYVLNVQDTLVGITVQPGSGTVLHPGEKLDPGLLNVTGDFSYTGKRKLNPSEFTVSPAAAPQTTGAFTVTVTVTRAYDNVTIRKTATVRLTVVPEEQKIDKSRVALSVERAPESIAFGVIYELPDVIAKAYDADGREEDIHAAVTWSLQHKNGEEWEDVPGFLDLPIQEGTEKKPLAFLPAEHGYFRAVYRAEAYGKEGTAFYDFSVMDTLTGISADLTDTPTEYFLGENLDLSRLTVIREFSSSGKSPVPEGEYRIDRGGFDRSKAGTYTVTVSYTAKYGGTKTDSFTVTVTDPVSSFTVTEFPSKRVYSYGDPIDMSGFGAKASLYDGSETDVASSDLEIRGFSPQTVGKQTVELLYHGYSGGTFEVTVTDTLFSIELDASGAKKEYRTDEIPDFSGLKVTWIGVSGERHLLNPGEYTVSPASFEGCPNGSCSVTVTCRDSVTGVERSASFRVTVTGMETSRLPLILGGAGILLFAALVIVILVIRRHNEE